MDQKLRNSLTAFLCTIALGSTQAQTLSESLIAHFPLDGSPNDVVNGLIPLDVMGTPAFCTNRFGISNSAACFDGASYWSYGDNLDLDTSDFTISIWCRTDDYEAPQLGADYPLAKGTSVYASPSYSGYCIGVRQLPGDTLRIYSVVGDQQSDQYSAEDTISYGDWYHLILSRCDTVLSMILNNEYVSSTYIPATANLNTNMVFTLGALDRTPDTHGPTGFFDGAIDDVRIYKGRCLGQVEIDSIFYGPTVGVPPVHSPDNELRIHPNPAADQLWITTSITDSSPGLLTVSDATGREVFVRNVNSATLELEVAHLKPGAYCVKLASERGRVYARFIKE